ncbi:uncharacterized protein [Chiloscyllium punctatum]|uniref:uncharacterized protein n=1 Tax=Chiloscyllium punctatum TaxID=137246 RepID=UPI003B63BC54
MYKTCPRRGGPICAQMAGGGNVSRGPPKTSKVHLDSRETESGGTQKEEQAGVEEAAASGETQQLILALAGQMEEMEEEVIKQAEEWIPVKNRKRKSCQAPKASQQKGKRQLHKGGTASSSEGEDGRKEGHHHQKKRQSISSQPGNDGPPEVHPPPSENQGVPTAPQLQATESCDPLTVPLSDTELDSEDPCLGSMTPERVNDPSEELDSYLSPAKVQQFVLTLGM